jgi:hypothetical protein
MNAMNLYYMCKRERIMCCLMIIMVNIGGGAIRLGEAQASPELETEGLERLNFVYIFLVFDGLIKRWET